MKKGDKVMIYEDPVTQLKPEGEAKLIKKIEEHHGMEYWVVNFLSDGYDVQRSIKKEKLP